MTDWNWIATTLQATEDCMSVVTRHPILPPVPSITIFYYTVPYARGRSSSSYSSYAASPAAAIALSTSSTSPTQTDDTMSSSIATTVSATVSVTGSSVLDEKFYSC